MREAAAERAERADPHVADQRGRLRQDRTVAGDVGRFDERRVACQRAEAKPTGVCLHATERKVVDVDDHARAREAIVQQRHQALAAGEDLHVVAMVAELLQRLVERRGGEIVEPRHRVTRPTRRRR